MVHIHLSNLFQTGPLAFLSAPGTQQRFDCLKVRWPSMIESGSRKHYGFHWKDCFFYFNTCYIILKKKKKKRNSPLDTFGCSIGGDRVPRGRRENLRYWLVENTHFLMWRHRLASHVPLHDGTALSRRRARLGSAIPARRAAVRVCHSERSKKKVKLWTSMWCLS